MNSFLKLEGDFAIVANKGVYKQVDLYTLADYLFAKHGQGFVRLYANGGTSSPNLQVKHIDITAPIFKDALGRLMSMKIPSKAVMKELKITPYNGNLTKSINF